MPSRAIIISRSFVGVRCTVVANAFIVAASIFGKRICVERNDYIRGLLLPCCRSVTSLLQRRRDADWVDSYRSDPLFGVQCIKWMGVFWGEGEGPGSARALASGFRPNDRLCKCRRKACPVLRHGGRKFTRGQPAKTWSHHSEPIGAGSAYPPGSAIVSIRAGLWMSSRSISPSENPRVFSHGTTCLMM